jgi:4-diphosphocytidyl-2-C-methyl-D-erythritol kinase
VGLAIAITKRIPVSAGLGGGSSNAAATILAFNELLQLGWSAPDMMKVGAPLGSDVPFFFCAPSAVVTGRGEVVEPVVLSGTRWVVLVNPGFPIETKWAYGQLSARRSDVAPLADSLRRIGGGATLSWDRMIPLMENDFEAAVGPAHPELGKVASALRGAGAEAAMLSGSGATVFGIFRDEAAAVRAKRALSATPGWRVFAGAAGTSPLACTSAA